MLCSNLQFRSGIEAAICLHTEGKSSASRQFPLIEKTACRQIQSSQGMTVAALFVLTDANLGETGFIVAQAGLNCGIEPPPYFDCWWGTNDATCVCNLSDSGFPHLAHTRQILPIWPCSAFDPEQTPLSTRALYFGRIQLR